MQLLIDRSSLQRRSVSLEMMILMYAVLEMKDEKITVDITSIISGPQQEKEEFKHGMD